MTTAEIQTNSHHSLPPMSPYLSAIANKKVEGLALSCFEAIAHWFLTVFSCFYPAYERFYSTLTIVRQQSQSGVDETQGLGTENSNPANTTTAIESTTNPLLVASISQETRDLDLITVWKRMPISYLGLPQLNHQSPAENAAAIRTWLLLPANRERLEGITHMLIEHTDLHTWPPEMDLLTSLESLRILDCPSFTEFSDNFNPKWLTRLDLKKTAVTSLPPNFNPPKLKTLTIVNTPITKLPEGFNPPQLEWTEELELLRKTAECIPSYPLLPASETPDAIIQDLDLAPLMSAPSITVNTPEEPVIDQKVLDEALVELYLFGIEKNIPAAERPSEINGGLAQCANSIRAWMQNNASCLGNIEILELYTINAATLPPEINLCKNLKKLHLSGQLFIKLPKDLDLPKLEVLSLIETSLTELPSSLNNHEKLTHLKIYNSKITELSDEFNPENLEIFELSITPITQLPSLLSNHKKLKKLHLYQTAIRTLPKEFNPENLEVLSLQDTPIYGLPEAAKLLKLKEFYIYQTKIERLPLSFDPPGLNWESSQRLKEMRNYQLFAREHGGYLLDVYRP